MSNSRWQNESLEPVTKICSYCERHKRLLRSHPNENQNFTPDRHHEDQQKSSHDSGTTDNFQDDQIDEALLKSSAIIRKYTERHQNTKIDSPTTSCLKNVANKRKTGPGKRVNFYQSSNNGSDRNSCHNINSSLMDDWDWSRTSMSSTSLNRRKNETELKEDSWQFSGSSSYYEPPMYDVVSKSKAPLRNRGGSSSHARNLDRLPRRGRSRDATDRRHHSQSRSTSKRRPIQSRDSSSGPASTSSPTRRSSTSSPPISSTIHLSDELSSRLSLSQDPETTLTSPRPTVPPPRILKPRDCMKRAALKKMLVYPPEGHTGSPVTLFKQWSNIDCHVQGDPNNGFRYKVYYLQKFESDKWFPRDDKTPSPFRRLDNAAAAANDSSTDYG
ncbi:hypothetical protein QAD02_006112 [Eretmocerus hayati]|uniref:Uncharacterized protein n=1 Tax=Eretmocerus hayati TaxID=131215 RepID=A0ACC2N054_9HYME|nr:hypothetical protein QAD02_006112 [Eretmocerus hayati]